MQVSEAVASRRSTRAFLDKPVDKDVLVRRCHLWMAPALQGVN